MSNYKTCYGKILPEFENLQFNKSLNGKAFGVEVKSFGIGVQGRIVTVDQDDWEKCVDCEVFRCCYDLSMAKLMLNSRLEMYG